MTNIGTNWWCNSEVQLRQHPDHICLWARPVLSPVLFSLHTCTCWCFAYELLLPFPSRKKDFCDMEQKHCAAASQLTACIPERSDCLLCHHSLHKWAAAQASFPPLPCSPPAFSLLTFDWLARQVNQIPTVSPDGKVCEQCITLVSWTPRSLFSTKMYFFPIPSSCRCHLSGFFTIWG